MMEHTLITIGRQFGSGGHEVGNRLAERLDIPLYDHNLLRMAARELGVSDEDVAKVDETMLGRFLSGYVAGSGEYTAFMSGEEAGRPLSDRLFEAQSELIRRLAQRGPGIFVGRCADYILDQEAYPTLNVFIHADMPHRISRVLERYGDTEVDVRKRLERKDRNRKTYYRYYTDREWGKYTNYQINLDSGYLGVDQCVRIIVDTVRAMDHGNDTAEQKTDGKNKA